MRAGKLDREITIERATIAVDANGTPVSTWATVATMRAEIIEAATDEANRAHGASSEAAIVFRMRFLDGVTLADRVGYDGRKFDIRQIKEIGRRRGLEIRVERAGP